NGAVVKPGFNAERLLGIRFYLTQLANDFIKVIAKDYHLPVRDTDKFARVGRLGIGPRLVIDLASQFTITLLDRGRGGHGRQYAHGLEDSSACILAGTTVWGKGPSAFKEGSPAPGTAAGKEKGKKKARLALRPPRTPRETESLLTTDYGRPTTAY